MGDYMWLIVVLLSIALVVGPVMMFKPSGRDRYLASLRQKAATHGLRVRMSRYAKAGKESERAVAVYSILLATNEGKPISQEWCLRRQAMEHDIHFSGNWDWDNSDQQAPQSIHAFLADFIDKLDDSIVAVECNRHSVGLWWKEKQLSVEEVNKLLNELREGLFP